MFTLKKKPQTTKFRDHRTISVIAHTAKIVANLEEGLKGKLRMYSEKISLGLEQEKKQGSNWDTENNIRTNLGNRCGTACLLHKLAEGI
jgi:rRNA processing protein Krr1/Pno1